jgi:hypothetical protein
MKGCEGVQNKDMGKVAPCDQPYLDARGTSKQAVAPVIIRVSVHTWDARVGMN